MGGDRGAGGWGISLCDTSLASVTKRIRAEGRGYMPSHVVSLPSRTPMLGGAHGRLQPIVVVAARAKSAAVAGAAVVVLGVGTQPLYRFAGTTTCMYYHTTGR